jgi:AmmeMemoRadiSam system protein A
MLDPSSLTEDEGRVLVTVARESLELELLRTPARERSEKWLQEPGASFVTLMLDGHLRGCVGSLSAVRPIVEDVGRNAVAAALQDSRFEPVSGTELMHLRVEVSVLSPVEDVEVASETELLESLRPGVDGLLLEAGYARATFLPQVWEQIPEPGRFLAQLRRKAGLPHGYWAPDLRVGRYTVRKFKEG